MSIVRLLVLWFLPLLLSGQNNALKFDGDDYIEIIPSATFDSNQDFTFSFWIKIEESTENQFEICKAVDHNSNPLFLVEVIPLNGSKKLSVFRSDGINMSSVSSQAIDDIKWHHIAVVKLKKMLFLYIDSELEAFVKDHTTFEGIEEAFINIGKGENSKTQFIGFLDEVKLRSKALSDTEVKEDMKAMLGADDTMIFALGFNESSREEFRQNPSIWDDVIINLHGFNSEGSWTEGVPLIGARNEETGWFGELRNAITNMRNGDPVNLQLSWFLKGLAGVCLFIFVIYLAVNWEMNRRKRRALEKEQQLNKELGKKKNELLSQSLHLAKKNEVINDINSELKEISKGVNTSNEKLNTILKTLRFEQNAEQDWEIFKTQFNEVHKGFDAKLKAISPEVTNTDIKLVAFLRMKMTNKEIANILNVQPMSVKKSKFRLRKKLNMSPEEFEAFLNEL